MKELKLYSKFIPHENVKERNEVKAFVAHKVTKELVNLFVTELGDDLVNCIQEKITDKLQDCLVRDPPGVTNYNRESYDIYNTTVAIGFDFDTIADFIVEHTSFHQFRSYSVHGFVEQTFSQVVSKRPGRFIA